ncbi:trypco2 family protein [Streptomyces sp. NPDC055189]
MHGIGLAEAVAALRAELLTALSEGDGSRIRFRAKSVQVEFEVQVQRSAQAAGGIKFWVVSGDASAASGRSATHRVALELEPVDIGGADDPHELMIAGAPTRLPD